MVPCIGLCESEYEECLGGFWPSPKLSKTIRNEKTQVSMKLCSFGVGPHGIQVNRIGFVFCLCGPNKKGALHTKRRMGPTQAGSMTYGVGASSSFGCHLLEASNAQQERCAQNAPETCHTSQLNISTIFEGFQISFVNVVKYQWLEIPVFLPRQGRCPSPDLCSRAPFFAMRHEPIALSRQARDMKHQASSTKYYLINSSP